MWTKYPTIVYCVLILISPAILHSYMIPQLYCRLFDSPDAVCGNVLAEINRNIAIINIVFGLLALVLIIAGVALAPELYNQTTQSKMEKRLIFQSIFSSTFLVLLYTSGFFATALSPLTFLVLSHFLYLMQFYPPIFILFIISPVIREEFANQITRVLSRYNSGTSQNVRSMA